MITIFQKKSTPYSLIWDCTITNFQHFPLYKNFIQACTIIKI